MAWLSFDAFVSRNSWQRLRVLSLSAVLIVFILSAYTGSARADPALSVSPASGSLFDHFTISGSSFTPGSLLKIIFSEPSGASYSLVDSYGNNESVSVRNDGGFDVQLQPSSDFRAKIPGTWKVQLCRDNSTCWSTDLHVTAAASISGYGGDGGMGDGGGGGDGGSGSY